jgi:hypothetical protein
MDLLYKYDGSEEKDYLIKLEMVEMDLKTEMEQNIYMNNKNVQGVYDYKALSLMLPEIDIDKTGLSSFDLDKISVFSPVKQMEQIKPIEQKKELSETEKKENIEKIKEAKKEAKEKAFDKHDEASEAHLTLVFSTWDNKVAFMEMFGLDIDDKMINGEDFMLIVDPANKEEYN